MNSKLVKKIRQTQRRQMADIPAEIDAAIKKVFLMGVDVGWKKATMKFESETGEEWRYGEREIVSDGEPRESVGEGTAG